MTIKDIERFCIKRSIKLVGMVTSAETKEDEMYLKGNAMAFMQLAALIQNGEIEESEK